jgi:UDP-2-acetamido-2-deoxy-ribo-hexuluronate aminotransferase
MDTLQAAILLAKLDRFDWEVEQRQEIAERYSDLLRSALLAQSTSEENTLGLPHIEPHNTSVYAQYTLQASNRDTLAKRLAAEGIPSAVHYPVPLHLQPTLAIQDHRPVHFPIAEDAAARVLSLPMGPDLRERDQRSIVSALLP